MESRRSYGSCHERTRCPSYLRTKADVLKSDIQDILDSGEVIPETLPSQMTETQQNTVHFKGVTEEVYSVADGQVVALEQVEDPVLLKNDG